MAKFVDDGFVLHDGLEWLAFGDGFLQLCGVIDCDGGVSIDVRKTLVLLTDEDADSVVQTVKYAYAAKVAGVRTIFRYCSPHESHNKEHHRHEYDVFGTGLQICQKKKCPVEAEAVPLFISDEAAVPTLGQVIEELRSWYHEHVDDVARLRAVFGR